MADKTPEPFDALDRRILTVLQEDAMLPLTELAERVGSSKSVCWRRMQRFLDEGIISRRVAILDPKALGFGVMALAFVKVDGRGEMTLEDFIGALRQIPEVIECHALMGDVDLVLKIVTPTIEDYEELLWGKLARLPGMVDIRSSISLTRFINTTSLPLQALRNRPRGVVFID
jgi:Lrp/AsnC family transcriptional regulator